MTKKSAPIKANMNTPCMCIEANNNIAKKENKKKTRNLGQSESARRPKSDWGE